MAFKHFSNLLYIHYTINTHCVLLLLLTVHMLHTTHMPCLVAIPSTRRKKILNIPNVVAIVDRAHVDSATATFKD